MCTLLDPSDRGGGGRGRRGSHHLQAAGCSGLARSPRRGPGTRTGGAAHSVHLAGAIRCRPERGLRLLTRTMPSLRLTDLTACGGCAAKLGADVLAEALAGLGAGAVDPGLLVGLDHPDDAAVYRLTDDLAVIGTLDFFPPLVDDPRTFGEIAAANALSDVFAMGGRVLFAMAIAALPEDLPRDAMAAIFEGAATKVREAGGTLAGGHTIRDTEPKYGLAVVGVAHPDRLFRKGGAREGDVLLLTKPLGTGLAHQRPAPGPDRCGTPGGGHRADAAPEPHGGRGPRRAIGCMARPTSRASASSVTASRWRGHPGSASSSMRRRCPRSMARSSSHAPAWRPAAPRHNRRFVADRAVDRRWGRGRARHPGARPADERWPACGRAA